jgi:hypothetical protein
MRENQKTIEWHNELRNLLTTRRSSSDLWPGTESYRHLIGRQHSDYIPPGLGVQRSLVSSLDIAERLGKSKLIAHAKA